MLNQFSRIERIYGKDAIELLHKSRVAVFGLGGVGGYVVEALARSGVGTLDLIDNDTICLTNLNRQIIATHKTVGQYKVDAAEERVHDICPDIIVNKHKCFYLPETAGEFDFTQYNYIVDAVDTVTAKIELVLNAQKAGTPIISSMGTGNKTDASALKVADISKTSVCPLARVMRLELKKRGVTHLKVVYSEEQPLTPDENSEEQGVRRSVPGSTAFVPGAAGLIIAGEVVRDLQRSRQ